MKTKSNVRFFSRAAHLDVDLELADVVRASVAKGMLSKSGGPYVFDMVDNQKHPRLAGRANTSQSRKLAVAHLKTTLFEAFLKNIYEDATQYLVEVLQAAARNGLDPNRLVGEHKVTFEANNILQMGSWDKVVSAVAESIFRRLENEKSTKDLLLKINSKLDLGVSQDIIDAALPYLEIRHLLVHGDGRVDKKFCTSFPEFNVPIGSKIKLEYSLIKSARDNVCALISEFDNKIVSKSVVSQSEMQP